MQVTVLILSTTADPITNLNLIEVMGGKGMIGLEKESVEIDGFKVRQFPIDLYHEIDARSIVSKLASEFDYIATIAVKDKFFHAAVPTQDEHGWQIELAEKMTEQLGYAGLGSNHWRTFAFH